MKRNTFTKFAGSTYTCRCCGRLTRDTGDNGSTRLCPPCFDLAGIENALMDADDKDQVIEDYGDEVAQHIETLRNKGGSLKHWAELINTFGLQG